MRSSKIRFRRTFAVAVALSTLGLIGLVAATPAQAVPPFDQQIFHPDEAPGTWGGNASESDYLTDKFDGHDNLAHLTAVATNDADRYRFYVCPTATADPPAPTAGGPAALGCTFIGEDLTPETPTFGGPFIGAADEAYEVLWDIPGSFDGLTRDIVGLACIGAETGTEPGGNCLAENEEDIFLEDAPTVAGQATSGEMVEFCALPVAASCTASSIGPGGSGPEYTPYFHGITVPNTGYSVRGYFSDDTTSFGSIFDFGADALTAPTTADVFSLSGGPIFTGVDFEVYEDSYTAGEITDDSEFAHRGIEDTGGGSGFCGAIFCGVDTHYGASDARETAQVHIHQDEDPDVDFSDNDDTFCEDSGREKSGGVETFERVEIIECTFDQFSYFADFDGDGDEEKHVDGSTSEDVTIELSGAGGGTFDDDLVDEDLNGDGDLLDAGEDTFACIDDTAFDGHDHDGDGLFEHCHFTGASFFSAFFVGTANGPVNALLCVDPEADDDTDPDHGCADAPADLTDSLTKTAGAGFDHVHLRFAEDAPGPAPACHTGAVSKDKQAGTNVSLTGCVQDQAHNGAAGIPVLWRIISGPGNFGPVEQTTDASGQADGQVTAPSATDGQVTTVRFCTDFNTNGICDADPVDAPLGFGPAVASEVQITWRAQVIPPPGGGTCPQVGGYALDVGTKGDDKMKGDADCNKLKGKKGNDKLSGKGEDDLLVGGGGFDKCRGGPGLDRFRGCEIVKKGSQVEAV